MPDPAPAEPDSDTSVEEVDMRIQDHLYGELEHAYHTHHQSQKILSTWEKAVPKDNLLERLNQNNQPVEDEKLKFLDDVLHDMKSPER